MEKQVVDKDAAYTGTALSEVCFRPIRNSLEQRLKIGHHRHTEQRAMKMHQKRIQQGGQYTGHGIEAPGFAGMFDWLTPLIADPDSPDRKASKTDKQNH